MELYKVIKSGNVTEFNYLLQRPDFDNIFKRLKKLLHDRSNMTLLYWATNIGNLNIVKEVLKHENINNQDVFDLLYTAMFKNDINLFREFIKHGADINALNRFNSNLLYYCNTWCELILKCDINILL